jgi:Family of unknown function (DUF6204)
VGPTQWQRRFALTFPRRRGDVTISLDRLGRVTSLRTFRVTVRGQFSELSDATRSYLMTNVEAHDIFLSNFSEEGTFTYDSRIAFFNLRYEVRVADPHGQNVAVAHALGEAERFLNTMRIGWKNLSAKSMDMSAMWQSE